MSILALLQTFIISVNEVMFYPAFVRLSVCLSVSNFTLKLLIGSSQKILSWIIIIILDKKNVVEFWKSPDLDLDLGIS